MFYQRILHAMRWFVLPICILVTGCAYHDLDTVDRLQSVGAPFSRELSSQYQKMAIEHRQNYDWSYALLFAQKAVKAAAGEMVAAEDPAEWQIQDAEINQAYQHLQDVLENGAVNAQPELAARAQAKFDCWLEQYVRQIDPKTGTVCQAELMQIFDRIENMFADVQANPKVYTVFFASGRFILDGEQQRQLDVIASDATQMVPSLIKIIGHTDNVGSLPKNLKLAQQRAAYVQQQLTQRGILAAKMNLQVMGPRDQAVDTPTGVAQPANRRVVVIFIE